MATADALATDLETEFQHTIATREDDLRHRIERELITQYDITDRDTMHDVVTTLLNTLYTNGLANIPDLVADHLHEHHPDITIDDLPDTHVNYSGIPFHAIADRVNWDHLGILSSAMVGSFLAGPDPASSLVAALVSSLTYYVFFFTD